ncbi:hypothetical protein B2G71_18655 [Novosphingobium sp. PC22D]|uniref:hypothetical protein n=1 Tax=Novosphingobium sp. PC22D TaxID=1962403 RepID=UPI000BF0671E|nr:hypothetical protein [Novosphingobium sp. PC22D]PEQ11066.1 hypothetical protein B2G71_18655 [Novosphingobium sp. PC22D]
MPRLARPPALNAKIYRHFAVVTILVTGAVALVTDDGGDGGLGSQAAAYQSDSVDLAIEADTKRRSSRRLAQELAPDDWGDDNDLLPTNYVDADLGGSPSYSSVATQAIAPARAGLRQGPPPGMTYEEWLAWLESTRKRSLNPDSDDAAPSSGDVQNLINQSRMRAGEGNE